MKTQSLPAICVPPRCRSRMWAAQRAVPVVSGDQARTLTSLQGLQVLLVDDSLETLDAFAALLALEGAVVQTADSGQAALQLCAAHQFDLVLSDIGMPGMDGYAFVRALRQLPQATPVTAYALSGFGDGRTAERALASGFQAYLAKPVTLEALHEAILRHPPQRRLPPRET